MIISKEQGSRQRRRKPRLWQDPGDLLSYTGSGSGVPFPSRCPTMAVNVLISADGSAFAGLARSRPKACHARAVSAWLGRARRLPGLSAATGVPVSARTILKLTRDLPQIAMLKHEDCPGLTKISTLRAAEEKGAPRLRSSVAMVGSICRKSLHVVPTVP